MDRWPRRHFLNVTSQKNYTRKRGKKMNNSVQEALKSAIDKLANIINKMSKNS